MSKTQSKTQRQQHTAAWKVNGRGKSRQFLAAIPAGTAMPADRVKLTSKAGVVTTGTLDAIHTANVDGLDLWTFSKDSKTPEQLASDRSKRAAATASYWDSDAGRETAQRIAARNAAKLAESADSADSQPAAPASKPQPASKPAPATESSASADMIAATVAALVAAGASADVIAATVAALDGAPAVARASVAAVQSKPASKPQPASKPARTLLDAATEHHSHSCEICGDKRRKVTALRQLDGATLDSCARCVSLDDDTARLRAARTAASI
jgi:hypothetical protein